ncbi:hypothetical protein PHYBOEH_008154 [Phytophthora boehmeriae]|uniref:BRCT domain-containing protein n=1 Tax=Phytophthora boehmeriae TaxID=109152 RepID=A0A8T1W2T9_9STRA|nr:hypothetical protein PHYBOEH_008154 [Phytophthora boehmeriae]
MAGAEATLAASLFNGMKFYLTYTLSRRRRSKLSQLIFKNGGVVSQSPAGATQLVDSEVLDSRHPEWVAASFVEDSVASGELQDINQYTGTVFSTPRKQTRGRQSYTTEDDARMLYFIKSIMNWKPMQAVPPSVWKIAERQKVTSHSSQSMFERFQNHLQRKTPMEQRDIMNKALLEFNVQPRNSEMEHDSDDNLKRTHSSDHE